MRVLHIVGGRLDGGAARGAHILSTALRTAGIDSRLVCADPSVREAPGVSTVAGTVPGRAAAFARGQAESLPVRLYPRRRGGIFSFGVTGRNWPAMPAYREADIVHLHWINRGMVSVEGLARMKKPIVWTMRDMWPFTGGCHCPLDCLKYRDRCGACPALGSHRERDASSWVQGRKMRSFPEGITFVGISDWLSDCARASALLAGRDVRTIPNSIATDVFWPVAKPEARAMLGLPNNRPVLLHQATGPDEPWKGGALLEPLKRELAEERLHICAFGGGPAGANGPVDTAFGPVRDPERLRLIYSAADVLVFPSVQESFGKVAGEALACATPVAAFGDTGLATVVRHRETGYLARLGDIEDMAAGVRWILSDGDRNRALAAAAAADAAERFDPALAAGRYLDLYREKLR